MIINCGRNSCIKTQIVNLIVQLKKKKKDLDLIVHFHLNLDSTSQKNQVSYKPYITHQPLLSHDLPQPN